MRSACALWALALLVGGCRTRLLDPTEEGAAADLAAVDSGVAFDLAPVDSAVAVDLAPVDARLPDGAPIDLASVNCGEQRCGPGQACVLPCCGGAGPQCSPAPDGGCQPPSQPCPFGAGGCYEPCTPPSPTCIDLPAACASSSTDLCACFQQQHLIDPCALGFGDSCANFSNGPPGVIECLCY